MEYAEGMEHVEIDGAMIYDALRLRHAQQYWKDTRTDMASRFYKLPRKTQDQIIRLLLTSTVTTDITTIAPVLSGMIMQAEIERQK